MNFYFSYKAEKQLGMLPRHIQERIREKMRFYAGQENPFSFAKKLTDQNGYRFRIGDHRALFIIQNNAIKVIKIVPRDRAYKDNAGKTLGATVPIDPEQRNIHTHIADHLGIKSPDQIRTAVPLEEIGEVADALSGTFVLDQPIGHTPLPMKFDAARRRKP